MTKETSPTPKSQNSSVSLDKQLSGPASPMTSIGSTKPKPEPVSASIEYKKIYPDVILPTRATRLSAGLDICAYIISETGRRTYALIPPRSSRLINTGLVLLAPPGYFLTVCSRSGLAGGLNPIFVANAPGVVDPDYTGELKIILYNGGHSSVNIAHGQRIAQIVPLRIEYFNLREITTLPETERSIHGFGSSDNPPAS